nr:hypothetical protein B0A51_17734 [Rachicladosporium sp. CCFEE 5018]
MRKIIDLSGLLIIKLDQETSSNRTSSPENLVVEFRYQYKAACEAILRDANHANSDDDALSDSESDRPGSFEEDIADILQDLIDLSPALTTAPPTTDVRHALEDDSLRRSVLASSDTMYDDDLFLLQLRDRMNMPWEDIASRFRKDKGKGLHVAALQIRYERLREGQSGFGLQRARSDSDTPDRRDVVPIGNNKTAGHDRDRRLPTPPKAFKTGRCPVAGCEREVQDLRSHMLTHQTQRPEKCPIPTCEYHTKGFARKYDKNRHSLTHYKGTMVCGFCPGSGSAAEKSFNRADVFKRHLVQVHQVEQPLPNTRSYKHARKATTKGTGLLDLERSGKCSVCEATITDAQKFYEHLDDCVLHVIQKATCVEDESKTTPSDQGIVPASVLPDRDSKYRVMYGVESDDEFWPQPGNYLESEDDLVYEENFPMSRNTSSKSRDSAYYSIGSVAAVKPDFLDVSDDPLHFQDLDRLPVDELSHDSPVTGSKLSDISEEVEDGKSSYCYCQKPSYGEMVACDDPTCQREWFHLACTGLSASPKELDIWICDVCEVKSETTTTGAIAETTSSKIVPAAARQTYPPSQTPAQNPPCNTLVVGNLPEQTSETELISLFSSQPGYKRLCFRTKQSRSTCLVEFEDVSFATKAMAALYDHKLAFNTNSSLRLSFAKSPLGVRSHFAAKDERHSKSQDGLFGKRQGRRTDYPLSWGTAPAEIIMKKRELAVYDVSRRPGKDNVTANDTFVIKEECSVKDEPHAITDQDNKTLRRAAGLQWAENEVAKDLWPDANKYVL